MFCAISGSVPEEPVVNKNTGHLFERKLVEKYIQETGKDPVTQAAATLEDLLPLATNKLVKPRPAAAASIPGLLGLFHDEWDALMLATYTLRQQLHNARKELSHALYQHDAACRVIARLVRERDEARGALDSVREQVAAELAAKRAAPEPMEEDAQDAKRAKAGIPQEVLDDIGAVSGELSRARKKRTVPEGTPSAEEVAALAAGGKHPLHKVTQPGILSLDLRPGQESVVATGGADATVQVFDLDQGRAVAELTGHSKRVGSLAFVSEDVLLTGSADKTVRLWKAEGEAWGCSAVLTGHTKEVTGVTVHPSRRYFVSASADGTWAFCDVATAQAYRSVSLEGGAGCTSAAFHPDGIILGTGTSDKLVRIWEAKSCKNVANFEGHTGPVVGLSFSENGYHLATVAEDGVKLWDLRKLKNIKALPASEGAPATSVAFDPSALFLAVGGADVRVYGTKQDWAQLAAVSDVPKKGVSALRWGPRSQRLYVGAADHNLRVLTL